MTGFESLYVRTESKKLFLDLYKIFSDKNFKDYFFNDQLLRATLSLSNNIAEGFDRRTLKEEKNFLGYAKGYNTN